jgi:hypothetical protein
MASTIQTSGELKARMTSLENSLRGHSRSASFGAGLTLLVGVVLIAGLAFYFWYGFTTIGSFLGEKDAAKNILDFIEGQLNDNMKPATDYVEKLVKDESPAWAKMASDSIVEGMPSAREHAVTASIAAMDESVNQQNEHLKTLVAAYIQKNEAKIKDAVSRLTGSKEDQDQFLKDLNESFAKEVEVDIEVVIKRVEDFVDGFNALLTKTNSDSKLTNLQAMQREILMLFKRALHEHTQNLPDAAGG